MHKVPIILGTPTTDWVIATLKESEIDQLATPWGCVRKNTLLQVAAAQVPVVKTDVASKPVDVIGYEEPMRLTGPEIVDPFETGGKSPD